MDGTIIWNIDDLLRKIRNIRSVTIFVYFKNKISVYLKKEEFLSSGGTFLLYFAWLVAGTGSSFYKFVLDKLITQRAKACFKIA